MIIFQALEFIRLNLNSYIISQTDDSKEDDVKLGNIALLTDSLMGNSELHESIYISLVNIHEESAFKNMPPVRTSEINSNYREPPIYLNLFVLISSCYRDYKKSLEFLSYVIQYFHTNKIFSFSNKPVTEIVEVDSVSYTFIEGIKNDLQLTFDLYSLTFEQLNYLWGSLGGRQVPFVLYKARVLEIDSKLQKKGGGYIEEIKSVTPKV